MGPRQRPHLLADVDAELPVLKVGRQVLHLQRVAGGAEQGGLRGEKHQDPAVGQESGGQRRQPGDQFAANLHRRRAVGRGLLDTGQPEGEGADGRPGDPAGAAKSTHYEETSFDLIKRCGLNSTPAPTNDLDPRLRAVEAFLGGQVQGGPMLLIDGSRCPMLVRALDGAYRYGKTRDGRRKRGRDLRVAHVGDVMGAPNVEIMDFGVECFAHIACRA